MRAMRYAAAAAMQYVCICMRYAVPGARLPTYYLQPTATDVFPFRHRHPSAAAHSTSPACCLPTTADVLLCSYALIFPIQPPFRCRPFHLACLSAHRPQLPMRRTCPTPRRRLRGTNLEPLPLIN